MDIGHLTTLQKLDLSGWSSLTALPASVTKLSRLEQLVLAGCRGVFTPPTIPGMRSRCQPTAADLPPLHVLQCLTHLNVSECGSLSPLPDMLPAFDMLQELDLTGCYCWTSCALAQLTALEKLRVDNCELLIELDVSGCTRLSRLDFAGCSQLKQLKASSRGLQDIFSSLEALTQPSSSSSSLAAASSTAVPKLKVLDLTGCSSLTQLPDSIFLLSDPLVQLSVRGYSSLISTEAWPSKISQLTNLTVLDVSGCMEMASSSQLPDLSGLQALVELGIGGWDAALSQLPELLHLRTGLRRLSLAGCTTLAAVPEAISKLVGLAELDLSGCSSLRAIPESVGNLRALTRLDLSSCSSLQGLPHNLEQLSLQELDLSGCSALHGWDQALKTMQNALGKYLAQCAIATALWHGMWILRIAPILPVVVWMQQYFKIWPMAHSFGDWRFDPQGTAAWFKGEGLCKDILLIVLDAQFRLQIILKLATQQDTMLSTLERMSWLVLLLATATFLAFIQPPGGYKDYQVLVTGPAACSATGSYSAPAAAPAQAYNISGLLTSNTSGTSTVTAAATMPGNEGLTHPHQLCALYLFFFFDTLSFCLSLGCVMVIVVLSMPRMQQQDDEFEAGRFWLLLLATWGLLYFAVVSGFIAFVCSAVAVFEGWRLLTIPFSICCLLLFLGLWVMAKRFFRDIFPSWAVVRKGLSIWNRDKQLRRVQDVEMAELVMSERFWERAGAAMQAAVSRGTRQPAGQLSAAADGLHAAASRLERIPLLERPAATSDAAGTPVFSATSQ